ncbi:MAG: ferritin family protein [Acidobacteria bacterium]|nr:ferritin family protein [Acidobacteriota bacterium]
MEVNVDFSTLTLMDALDLAILIEEEARERYEESADQMEVHHTSEAADFYKFMAANESKHGEELSVRRRQMFGEAPRRVKRSMIWDVEAPEYDKARAFMTPRQALEVAMESETKAYEFFEKALEYVSDPGVREIFQELLGEEEHHKDLVRQEMAKLPPESDLDPSEFADEPVAQ